MQQRCSRRVWGHTCPTQTHTQRPVCVCVCGKGRPRPPSLHLEAADDGDVCAAEEEGPSLLIHSLVMSQTTSVLFIFLAFATLHATDSEAEEGVPCLRGVPAELLSKQSRNAKAGAGSGALSRTGSDVGKSIQMEIQRLCQYSEGLCMRANIQYRRANMRN